MSQGKTLWDSLNSVESFAHWVQQNKLQALGSTWALGVGTAFALQWRHNTPLQLKFFQTRIASQAITVAALCGAALISVYDKEEQAEPVRSLSHKRTWR